MRKAIFEKTFIKTFGEHCSTHDVSLFIIWFYHCVSKVPAIDCAFTLYCYYVAVTAELELMVEGFRFKLQINIL